MLVPLHPESVRAFRILNDLSLAFGVINVEAFVAREWYLRELLGAPATGGGFTQGGGEHSDEPIERSERKRESQSIPHPGFAERGGTGNDEDWLYFTPGGPIGHLKRWQFIVGDPDPHPSVPHGHDEGRAFPKLDPYLGWVHVSTIATGGRLSHDDTRALWNDNRFREFASAALVHFIRENPAYRWRLDHPLRLPRRKRRRRRKGKGLV